MLEAEYGSLLFGSRKGDFSPEDFFSEEFHGKGPDPPAGLLLCAEIALEDASGYVIGYFPGVPDAEEDSVSVILIDPYLDDFLFVAGLEGIDDHVVQDTHEQREICCDGLLGVIDREFQMFFMGRGMVGKERGEFFHDLGR